MRLTPTSSTIILSSPTGPSDVLTTLAIEMAAITATQKSTHAPNARRPGQVSWHVKNCFASESITARA